MQTQIYGLMLLLVSGVFWTSTYLAIIRRGFVDRTYGMPLVALCANLSWEFTFAFVHPPFAFPPYGVPQMCVNVVWFLFDSVILFQLLKSWSSEFPDLTSRLFYPTFLLALATSFCTILFVTYEFDDGIGAYSAFGQNLMMSILFITMLFRRGSLRGQSFYIALFKMVGTLAASLAFILFPTITAGSILLPFLSLATLVFDLIYVAMVYGTCKRQAINPWKCF
jgi:hypothetical protein